MDLPNLGICGASHEFTHRSSYGNYIMTENYTHLAQRDEKHSESSDSYYKIVMRFTSMSCEGVSVVTGPQMQMSPSGTSWISPDIVSACEAVCMFHHGPPFTAVSAVIVCMSCMPVLSVLAAFHVAVLSQVTVVERRSGGSGSKLSMT